MSQALVYSLEIQTAKQNPARFLPSRSLQQKMKNNNNNKWLPSHRKKVTTFKIKNYLRGFPGGAVVGSPPANAGDAGSRPGLGRSHMPRSGWAREPQLLSLRVWSLCSATGEAAIVRGLRTAMRSGLHLPQLEKALAQKRRLKTAINK